MKIFRKALRYWIAIASVLSFLGGWVILAHSPKPVQPQPATVLPAALPSLPPIQAYGGTTTSNGITFFSNPAPANPPVNPQPSPLTPVLRTRGS